MWFPEVGGILQKRPARCEARIQKQDLLAQMLRRTMDSDVSRENEILSRKSVTGPKATQSAHFRAALM